MTEVQKQKEIVRWEEEPHDDTIREWEEGLPSLADLISLSQCLISPQLASAFSIPSSSPTRSLTASLPSNSHAHPGRPAAPPASPLAGDIAVLVAKYPHLQAVGAEASHLNPHRQLHPGDRSLLVINASERIHSSHVPSDEINPAHFSRLDAKERSNGGEASIRECLGISQPADAGWHLGRRGGDTSVSKDHGSSTPLNGYAGVLKGDEDRVGEGGGRAHASAAPCTLDSSDEATQADADGEAEEAESAPSPAENTNEETMVRTLKRPRLVWTPELHKRFVDAVLHLGVKTAVPKTIMQLMNVEGLTRENVASHLQKYRLYLKRMQGLSNEGPMSSDHVFASTAVPANLATAGSFHTGMPAHLQEMSQVAFAPSHNPVSTGRGHVVGIMSGPLPLMDPYSFNIFARPPSHRFVQGDLQEVQASKQPHPALSEHILKK